MDIVFIQLFQWGSIVVALGLAILCATVWRERRYYGWMLLSFMLSIPFEWYADEYWMFYYYRREFIPLFGDFPMYLPFAWAWFFWTPLVLLLARREKLARLPAAINVLLMFVIFFIQDFAIESCFTSVTTGRLWTYYGYPASMMVTKTLPWNIPIWVGLSLPVYYYMNLWALRRTSSETKWWRGALTFLAANYAAATLIALVGTLVSVKLLGLPVSPRPSLFLR